MKNLPWERPDLDPSCNLEFIVHTDLKVNSLTNPSFEFFFPRGTPATFYPFTHTIFVFGVRICYSHSHTGQKHFCRNDDSNGLLRRRYTYALADSNRKRILKDGYTARFTEDEAAEITRNWRFFLNPDHPQVFLFNDNFYNANLDDLRSLAKALHIYVNEDMSNDEAAKISGSGNRNGNKSVEAAATKKAEAETAAKKASNEVKIISTSELSIKN